MVRDQALALSGLLSHQVGGPSVYPPQPDGLWQAAFNGQRTWATSQGDDRYRRALYTFWRRTTPYPSMSTFDAPSREICTVRRVRTNTPLQAFVTLNDPVYVEAAQALARRIVARGGPSVEDAHALRLAALPVPHTASRGRSSVLSTLSSENTIISRRTPTAPSAGDRAARARCRAEDGTGRAGGVDGGGQCAVEPRWCADEGLISWNFDSSTVCRRRPAVNSSWTRRPAWARLALADCWARAPTGPLPATQVGQLRWRVRPPQFAAKAKHVIYLHMSGAPPQQDLFDYKPELVKHDLEPCPDSLLKNERFAFIKGHPKLLGTPHKFARHAARAGRGCQRALAQLPTRGRRGGDRPLDAHRPVQPCAGRAVAVHRARRGRRRGDGLVDHVWAGLGEPRICPASSC